MSNEIAKAPGQCVGWDCGAGAIRIANMDIRYRPEPQLITSQMDDRHFLAMTCMRIPQAFHRSTLFNTPAHIIMDAFRCKPTQSKCMFCVSRENGGYSISSHRRIVKNKPTKEDFETYGIQEDSEQFYKQEDVMESIIREVSKAFSVRNVVQNGVFINVPDAASLGYIRKLRHVFKKVFNVNLKKLQVQEPLSIQECPSALEARLTDDCIHIIQRTAAAVQMYLHRRSGAKVYDHNRSQFQTENRVIPPNVIILPRVVVVIAFGAGHFSSAVYKEESFERYGFRHLFNQSDAHLGGEDLCYRLCEYIVNVKLDPIDRTAMLSSKRLLKFLRNTMDQAKIDLSGFSPAIVDIEVNDDKVETFEITREQFENEVAQDLFEKVATNIRNLKEFTESCNFDVTDVLLVRGSTRNKKVLDLVDHYFKEKPIVKCLNTDECIVMGTAIKGALKNGIHRTAYAEVEEVAMQTQTVEIDGITLYLTKKHESVQNSKKHWIKTKKGFMTYNGEPLNSSKLEWVREVACDPFIMTQGEITDVIVDEAAHDSDKKN